MALREALAKRVFHRVGAVEDAEVRAGGARERVGVGAHLVAGPGLVDGRGRDSGAGGLGAVPVAGEGAGLALRAALEDGVEPVHEGVGAGAAKLGVLEGDLFWLTEVVVKTASPSGRRSSVTRSAQMRAAITDLPLPGGPWTRTTTFSAA